MWDISYLLANWNSRPLSCCRFSPKEKVKRPNNVHLPFGAGPRNCIGMRLALLEAKILLIEVLRQFSFIQGPNTKVSLTIP